MTLRITGDQIIIQNAFGAEKFNSNNKLVYKKYTTSGSATIGAGYATKVAIGLGTTFDHNKDMALIYVTPTGGGGNVTGQVLNSTLQLNFPFLMHFAHSTTEVAITAWDVLTGVVTGSTLEFAAVSLAVYAYSNSDGAYEKHLTATTAISFNWKLVILSYR